MGPGVPLTETFRANRVRYGGTGPPNGPDRGGIDNERAHPQWTHSQQVGGDHRGDPGHSTWYVERFRAMEAKGQDIVGEARLVDAMLGRGGRVLDAGCGLGRLGGYLHDAGHVVVGVDVDPVLIGVAEEDHPGPTWLVGDLAELDLPPAASRPIST